MGGTFLNKVVLRSSFFPPPTKDVRAQKLVPGRNPSVKGGSGSCDEDEALLVDLEGVAT